MSKNDKKYLTLPAHFYAEPNSAGHSLALLHLIAQDDRVVLYGRDGYEDSDERHQELPRLIVDEASFKNAVIGWLAWRLGIPEDTLRKLPEKLDHLERYRAAYESLDEAFDDVPGYMGDESYGDKLSRTLVTARDLAKWKSISLTEFQDELDIDPDGGK